jgi:hypothetical protein
MARRGSLHSLRPTHSFPVRIAKRCGVTPGGVTLLCLTRLENATDLVPQREAVLPLVRGKIFQLARLTQARQVRVAPPARQRLPHPVADRGAAVQRLAPGSQVRPQPLPRLVAPALSLRLKETCRVPTAATAGQGGRASGVVAVAGTEILRQVRGCGKGIGVEAGRRAGAVCELAGPQQGEPLVIVLGLVLPV